MLPVGVLNMTDKKRGRPSVKKDEQNPMGYISLPTPRACLAFREANKDSIAAYRSKHPDKWIIKTYESLHDPESLSELFYNTYKIVMATYNPESLVSGMIILNRIPTILSGFEKCVLLMGGAYFDVILGGKP